MAKAIVRITCYDREIRKFGGNSRTCREIEKEYRNMSSKEMMERHGVDEYRWSSLKIYRYRRGKQPKLTYYRRRELAEKREIQDE